MILTVYFVFFLIKFNKSHLSERDFFLNSEYVYYEAKGLLPLNQKLSCYGCLCIELNDTETNLKPPYPSPEPNHKSLSNPWFVILEFSWDCSEWMFDVFQVKKGKTEVEGRTYMRFHQKD